MAKTNLFIGEKSSQKASPKIKRYFVLPENLLVPEDMKAWVTESIEVLKKEEVMKEIQVFRKNLTKIPMINITKLKLMEEIEKLEKRLE